MSGEFPETTRPHAKMPMGQRAKQFQPFAALKGFSEALAAKLRITVPRRELCCDAAEELDRKMHLLEKGKVASIVYYSEEEKNYLKRTGMICGFDLIMRRVTVVDTVIGFDDIVEVELEE